MFLFPRPQMRRLQLFLAQASGLSPQRHRLPLLLAQLPGIGSGFSVSRSGERGRRGGGMRASDIGGVGGPVATPAPGQSLLPLLPPLPAPLPGIGGGSSIDNILQHNVSCSPAPTVVAQWLRLLTMICKVLGSIPDGYIFESD